MSIASESEVFEEVLENVEELGWDPFVHVPEVDVEKLPDGAEEGVWMFLELEGDEVVSMTLDEETTSERRERMEEKMERLRERGRKSSEKVE